MVNEDVLSAANLSGQNKKEMVLEQKDNQLDVNNGLTVIPFSLSEDGNSLRIRENKYIKITDREAKTAMKNRQDCNQSLESNVLLFGHLLLKPRKSRATNCLKNILPFKSRSLTVNSIFQRPTRTATTALFS